MHKIFDRILTGTTLLCDGAWGTELFKLGLQPGDCLELCNINRTDWVAQIAKSYVEAGSDIIQTNSFGGSPIKLRSFGIENRAYEINRKAAEISRTAAGDQIFVAGSIGPSGKMLIMGEISEQELFESFSLQAEALEDGGANAAIIETMIDPAELSIAVRAVKQNTNLEIIASATYNKTPAGFKTAMGATIEDMVKSAINEGASIIGTNCGHGSEMIVEIVREIHRLFPAVPIIVQPNAGLPYISNDGSVIYPESPDQMAQQLPSLISAGANIIGGCCGTTPEHIRAFRKLIVYDRTSE